MRKMTFALFAILSALMFQGCKEQNFGASGGDGGKKPGQNNGKPKVPSGGTTANGPSPQPSNQPTPQPTTQPNPEILRTDEGLLKSPGNLTSIVGIGFEDSGTDRDFNDMSFCMDMDKTEHLFISGRTIKVASNKSLKITILRLGGNPGNPYSAEIRVTSPKTGEKTVFNEPMTKFVPKTININVEPGDELKFFLRLVGENIVTAHTSASKALIEKGSCRNTGI